jgi:hypothetical protein
MLGAGMLSCRVKRGRPAAPLSRTHQHTHNSGGGHSIPTGDKWAGMVLPLAFHELYARQPTCPAQLSFRDLVAIVAKRPALPLLPIPSFLPPAHTRWPAPASWPSAQTSANAASPSAAHVAPTCSSCRFGRKVKSASPGFRVTLPLAQTNGPPSHYVPLQRPLRSIRPDTLG